MRSIPAQPELNATPAGQQRKNRKRDAAAEPTELPAKPYEPTPAEAKVLATYARRKEDRQPVPGMKISMSKEDGAIYAHMEVDHQDKPTGYKLLASAVAVGAYQFLKGLLDTLGSSAQSGAAVKESLLNFGISIIAGLQPKDHVEALLASQMAAIHIATMTTAANFGGAGTHEMRFAQEKALNRLTRTFAAQVEALKRYRSKGEQRVYVERVNVERGGQAIVGPVTHGGRGGGDDDESDR